MDENELIRRCLDGDAGAWDALFDAHYAAAGRFVFQLGPALSAEDVEEICQETFLAVIRNLSSFKHGSRLQTWILRIAANKARDFLERTRAVKRGGGQITTSLNAEDPETGLTPDPPSTRPEPDRTAMAMEDGRLLRAALDALGDPCREIIELRYFSDLSYEEIAATLSLNPKTVSSRLSKCLDRLEATARPLFTGGQSGDSPV